MSTLKVGIVSDTHGCLDTWNKVFNRFLADAKLIIHAGDVLYHGPRNPILPEYNPAKLAEVLNDCKVPIMVAAGNCDAEVDEMVLHMPIQSSYIYVMIEGRRIVVSHGHNLTEQSKQDLAKRFKTDIFITGHTHVPVLERVDGVIYLNPGSPGMSKSLDRRGTIALLLDDVVQILDVATGEILYSIDL